MRSALLLARPTLLLAPLLLPFVVPLAMLPPAGAYVVSEARWLVVLGAICAETSLLLASAGWNMERVRLRLSRLIGALPPRSFAILVWMLRCTRLRPTDPQQEARWRAIRNVRLAWGSTLAVGSGLLRALGT
jgi:hypothetical protein